MTVHGLRVHHDTYLDSLLIMATTVTMDQREGVRWAGAVMATPRGLDDLAAAGFDADELDGLDANDLVLAVAADDEATLEAALDAGREAAFAERRSSAGAAAEAPPADLAEAVRREPGMTVAVVSVPGEYAALEAHHALTAGLHVLLFSDNVPVEEEVELKERALQLGRLVMGPGAGTAVLAGTGLGFANVLTAEPAAGTRGVGVVAAAGTGAQEVSSLLDRWGVRVTQVIGVGGRDLSAQVGGRMAGAALRALDADPATGVVLLVSKPPDLGVAASVLAQCRDTPVVAVYLGLDEGARAALAAGGAVRVVPTLEAGARAAAGLAGVEVPTPRAGLRERVAEAARDLPAQRRTVRGLFSGGTLCYEAQYVLEGVLGPVWSNEPLRAERTLPAPHGAAVLLDLGAEEYTRGRPHPMIDPESRLRLLRETAADPAVAVVLLDVVLGHGSAEDPGGGLAAVCAELPAGGPRVVVHLLGTEADPQRYSVQLARLEESGCLVAESNAGAARAAAAIALRRPELVEEES